MNRRITRLEHALYRRFPVLQRLVRTRQYWYRESLAILLQRPGRTVALEGIARLRLLWQVRDGSAPPAHPQLPDGLQADHRVR